MACPYGTYKDNWSHRWKYAFTLWGRDTEVWYCVDCGAEMEA